MIAGEIQVRDAFLAALMLTGTIEAAEHAVSDAIATSGCGVAAEDTARCDGEVRGSTPGWVFPGSGDTFHFASRASAAVFAFFGRSPMFRLANVDGTHPGGDLRNFKFAQR